MTSMEPTNQKRAERTFRTMLVYTQYVGNDEGDHESTLTDLLTDLIHFAEAYNLDIDSLLERAWDHYEFEKQEAQESPQ